MPPLDDSNEYCPAIQAAIQPQARALHPSPLLEGLRLEAVSPREATYLGHVFGVDEPYLMVPSGFGEWIPLIYGGGQ